MKRLNIAIVMLVLVFPALSRAQAPSEDSIERLLTVMQLDETCLATDQAIHAAQIDLIRTRIAAAFGAEVVKPRTREYLDRYLVTTARSLSEFSSLAYTRAMHRSVYQATLTQQDVDRMIVFWTANRSQRPIEIGDQAHRAKLWDLLSPDLKAEVSSVIAKAKEMNRKG